MVTQESQAESPKLLSLISKPNCHSTRQAVLSSRPVVVPIKVQNVRHRLHDLGPLPVAIGLHHNVLRSSGTKCYKTIFAVTDSSMLLL